MCKKMCKSTNYPAASKTKPHCCFVGCKEGAEWQLWHGDGPEDYTESCTDHVGVMLTDAEVTHVLQITRQKKERTVKMGMYGQTPKVQIGKLSICEAQSPPNDSVWIEEEGVDGGEFGKAALAETLKKWYDTNL